MKYNLESKLLYTLDVLRNNECKNQIVYSVEVIEITDSLIHKIHEKSMVNNEKDKIRLRSAIHAHITILRMLLGNDVSRIFRVIHDSNKGGRAYV